MCQLSRYENFVTTKKSCRITEIAYIINTYLHKSFRHQVIDIPPYIHMCIVQVEVNLYILDCQTNCSCEVLDPSQDHIHSHLKT